MSAQFKKMRACACVLFLCFSTSQAVADETEKKAAMDAQTKQGDRTKAAAIFEYSSVFDDYVPFDEIPDISWREANDNVGRIGGWRAYAELVQEEVMKEKEAMAEGGAMKDKEAMAEEGVMKDKEAMVDEGVMKDKEIMVDEGVMKDKEIMTEEGAMKDKEAMAEEAVMKDKEAVADAQRESQLKEGDKE